MPPPLEKCAEGDVADDAAAAAVQIGWPPNGFAAVDEDAAAAGAGRDGGYCSEWPRSL